jgi:hypothetical protein
MEVLTSQITGFESLAIAFSQLSNLRFRTNKARTRVKSLFDELKNVNDDRNRIVHGRWIGIPSDAILLTRYNTRSATLKWGLHTYAPNDVDKIAKRMWRLHLRILRFGLFVSQDNAKRAKRIAR